MTKEERNLIKKKIKETGFKIGDIVKDKKTGQYWQIDDLNWEDFSSTDVRFCLTQKIERDCPEDLEELENLNFMDVSYEDIQFIYRP